MRNNYLIKCLLLAVTLIIGKEIFAQQQAQFSMYMFNPLLKNSAYAGSRDALSITLLGRNQWVGIDGAPKTGTLSLHTPLKNQQFCFGFSAEFDKIGANTNTGTFFDFAYRINVSEKFKLSFGLKAGADFYNANYNKLIVVDNNDPNYNEPVNSILPNFGLGAYLYSDRTYIGLSAPKLLESNYKGSKEIALKSKIDRHYFLTAGHSFKLNSIVDMIPSFVVKAVKDAPLSLDVNLNFMFFDKLWIGGGYRVGDAVIGNLVYHFSPKLRLGYAYDYTLSELSNYNSGSHELMINYDLDFLGKGFKTPRKF